jgi:hypothetical protein
MINKQYMHNVGKYQNYLYDLKKHLEKRAIMSCFTASANEFDITQEGYYGNYEAMTIQTDNRKPEKVDRP